MVGIGWYHGTPMVPPERQGAFWIVGIGSRSSAFRECDLDLLWSESQGQGKGVGMTLEIVSLHFSHKRRGILARVGFRKRDRDPSLSHGSQELDAALKRTLHLFSTSSGDRKSVV